MTIYRERAWMAVALLGLLGCPRAPTEPTHAPDPQVSVAPDPALTRDTDAELCRAPRAFGDYDWIPDDTRLATSIQRHDPALADALALVHAHAADPAEQLPVFAALDLRNLGMQLANLDQLLARLDLDPAELVELHGPAGEQVWSWSTDCPPATVAARVLDRFGVMLRADLQRPGLRWGVGSIERFPFDVMTFGDHRVAVTLVGHGQAIGAWLHDGAHGGDEGPGRRLRDLSDAPIRAVLDGEALLDPAGTGAAARRRSIRVTAQDWIIDPDSK